WGTDSIWYGSPRDQIEAFRTFTISRAFQEQYGYPDLTPKIKAKIFGLNSARLYGVQPITTKCNVNQQVLDDARQASRDGNATYGPVTPAQVLAVQEWEASQLA